MATSAGEILATPPLYIKLVVKAARMRPGYVRPSPDERAKYVARLKELGAMTEVRRCAETVLRCVALCCAALRCPALCRAMPRCAALCRAMPRCAALHWRGVREREPA